jgi:crotonobetainyl-CoA:carnitine CoA-transferase CaiB-like acyl-CoA transferase
VNELKHAFSDPQALARNMKVDVPLTGGARVAQPGNPIKLSETYADIYTAPPAVGQDTARILGELLNLDADALAALAKDAIIDLGSRT